jgi:chromosome segregation ATPase
MRVTVAVGLLLLAALEVTGAALSGSWLIVTCAAGLGVLLGAAATRITHSELTDSRRTAAADRASQAKAYAALSEQRITEHSTYVTDMQARITEREQTLEALEGALCSAQRRAAESTRKRNAEGRRAAGLQVSLAMAEGRHQDALIRISQLEQEVVVLRAELDSMTTAWHAADNARRSAG